MFNVFIAWLPCPALLLIEVCLVAGRPFAEPGPAVLIRRRQFVPGSKLGREVPSGPVPMVMGY
jgi:hypothetical protein